MIKHGTIQLVIIIFIFFIFCPMVSGQDWDTTDKLLLSAFAASLIIDYGQTRYIFEHAEYHEKNSFITSKNATPFYFGLAGITSFFIANSLDGKKRKGFLAAITTIEIFTIGNNYAIGIGFKF